MTAYLWKADQTEPGKTGATYAATQRNEPPAHVEPTPAADGEAFINHYDQPMIRMQTKEMAGTVMDLAEVARLGWYSR